MPVPIPVTNARVKWKIWPLAVGLPMTDRCEMDKAKTSETSLASLSVREGQMVDGLTGKLYS